MVRLKITAVYTKTDMQRLKILQNAGIKGMNKT